MKSTVTGEWVSKSWPRLFFGNAITVANRIRPRDEHDEAVESDGEAAMRRCAKGKGAQQMAEFLLLLFGIDAEHFEHAR